MSHAALPVLYTIPLSHYCEPARWALDWAGVPYREERHLQLFHRRPVRRAGGGHTVPVLRTPSGTLADSAAIVAWADEHAPAERKLYPAAHPAREHVLALERTFSEELGVETRRLAYFSFLPYGSLLLRYNNQGAPWHEKVLLRLGFPLAKRILVRHFHITAQRAAAAESTIARIFDEVAAHLADGRPYLTGEQFRAADLTFASMAAVVLLPENYGVPLPQVEALPEEFAHRIQRYRSHPAGAFALRLYATARGRSDPR